MGRARVVNSGLFEGVHDPIGVSPPNGVWGPRDEPPWVSWRPSRRGEIPRQYPPELKERAIRLVAETIVEQGGQRHGAVGKVAAQLGIGSESLRHWVAQAEIDAGTRPGLSTTDRDRVRELERENFELRRANEILKSAATFFGAELDRRSKR